MKSSRHSSRRKTLSPSMVKTFLSGVDIDDDPTTFPDPPSSTPLKVLAERDQNIISDQSSVHSKKKPKIKRKNDGSCSKSAKSDFRTPVGSELKPSVSQLKVEQPINVQSLVTRYLKLQDNDQESRIIGAKIYAQTGYPVSSTADLDFAEIQKTLSSSEYSIFLSNSESFGSSVPFLSQRRKILIKDATSKLNLVRPLLEPMKESNRIEKEELANAIKLFSKRMPDGFYRYFEDESCTSAVPTEMYVDRYMKHICTVSQLVAQQCGVKAKNEKKNACEDIAVSDLSTEKSMSVTSDCCVSLSADPVFSVCKVDEVDHAESSSNIGNKTVEAEVDNTNIIKADRENTVIQVDAGSFDHNQHRNTIDDTNSISMISTHSVCQDALVKTNEPNEDISLCSQQNIGSEEKSTWKEMSQSECVDDLNIFVEKSDAEHRSEGFQTQELQNISETNDTIEDVEIVQQDNCVITQIENGTKADYSMDPSFHAVEENICSRQIEKMSNYEEDTNGSIEKEQYVNEDFEVSGDKDALDEPSHCNEKVHGNEEKAVAVNTESEVSFDGLAVERSQVALDSDSSTKYDEKNAIENDCNVLTEIHDDNRTETKISNEKIEQLELQLDYVLNDESIEFHNAVVSESDGEAHHSSFESDGFSRAGAFPSDTNVGDISRESLKRYLSATALTESEEEFEELLVNDEEHIDEYDDYFVDPDMHEYEDSFISLDDAQESASESEPTQKRKKHISNYDEAVHEAVDELYKEWDIAIQKFYKKLRNCA